VKHSAAVLGRDPFNRPVLEQLLIILGAQPVVVVVTLRLALSALLALALLLLLALVLLLALALALVVVALNETVNQRVDVRQLAAGAQLQPGDCYVAVAATKGFDAGSPLADLAEPAVNQVPLADADDAQSTTADRDFDIGAKCLRLLDVGLRPRCEFSAVGIATLVEVGRRQFAAQQHAADAVDGGVNIAVRLQRALVTAPRARIVALGADARVIGSQRRLGPPAPSSFLRHPHPSPNHPALLLEQRV
jgi:hypothetical protein